MKILQQPNHLLDAQDFEINLLKEKINAHDMVISELRESVEKIRAETSQIKKISSSDSFEINVIRKLGVFLIVLYVAQTLSTIWWAGRTDAQLTKISTQASSSSYASGKPAEPRMLTRAQTFPSMWVF